MPTYYVPYNIPTYYVPHNMPTYYVPYNMPTYYVPYQIPLIMYHIKYHLLCTIYYTISTVSVGSWAPISQRRRPPSWAGPPRRPGASPPAWPPRGRHRPSVGAYIYICVYIYMYFFACVYYICKRRKTYMDTHVYRYIYIYRGADVDIDMCVHICTCR